MSRRSWYVVGVLTVAYTFSYIDRSVLGLMVGPIRAELGISDTQFSLLQGFAFAIFYTLLGIPIAWLADRASRRNIISAGIAVWSLTTALCGLARTFGAMFVARVGVGVGEAALSPAAYSMIADLFPREKRAVRWESNRPAWFIGSVELHPGRQADRMLDYRDAAGPGRAHPWLWTLIILGVPRPGQGQHCVFTFREPKRLRQDRRRALERSGRLFGKKRKPLWHAFRCFHAHGYCSMRS